MEYLLGARTAISDCIRATASWSAPYDGENPPPAIRSLTQSEKSTPVNDAFTFSGVVPTDNGAESSGKDSDFTMAAENGQTEQSTMAVDVVLDNTCMDVLEAVECCAVNKSLTESQIEVGVDGGSADVVDGSAFEQSNGEWAVSSVGEKTGGDTATDSFDVFLRQLSHVPARGDEMPTADVFSAFDALVEQLSEKVFQSVVPVKDLIASVSQISSPTGASDCVDGIDSTLNIDENVPKLTEVIQRIPESSESEIEVNMSTSLPTATVSSLSSNCLTAAVAKTEVCSSEVSSSGSPLSSYHLKFASIPSPTSNALPSIGKYCS